MDQVQYIYTNESKEKKVCTIKRKETKKEKKKAHIKTATKTTNPLCFETTWKECLRGKNATKTKYNSNLTK